MSLGVSSVRQQVRADAREWPRPEPVRLGLTDATTIDRHLAHKQTAEQVFINDVARDGETLVALGELPKMHRFFNDSITPGYDALLIAEFIRQGVEVIAHALLGVPLTSQFVLRTVELELVGQQVAVPANQAAPAVIAFREGQVRRNRSGSAYAASGPVYCYIGGRPAARLGGTVGFMARDTYDELRAERGEPRLAAPSGSVAPSEPKAVGRQFPENALIGQPEGLPREARCLVVPRLHPAFFDRPLDHYPGMMIAEAARQLAASCLSADVCVPVALVHTGYAALDFVSFAELGPPLSLEVTRWTDLDSGADITITARQGTRTTSACRFRLFQGAPAGDAP